MPIKVTESYWLHERQSIISPFLLMEEKKNGNNFFNVVFLVFLKYLYLFVVCTYLTYSSVLCPFDLITFYRLYLLFFKILFCYKIKKKKIIFSPTLFLFDCNITRFLLFIFSSVKKLLFQLFVWQPDFPFLIV